VLLHPVDDVIEAQSNIVVLFDPQRARGDCEPNPWLPSLCTASLSLMSSHVQLPRTCRRRVDFGDQDIVTLNVSIIDSHIGT
jgi:hypothetical protein